MKIIANLAVNGNINIVDDEDDSPLLAVSFSNEASSISDAGRSRIAAALKIALAHELAHCGVIRMPTEV